MQNCRWRLGAVTATGLLGGNIQSTVWLHVLAYRAAAGGDPAAGEHMLKMKRFI
jgi:hypothetical protein